MHKHDTTTSSRPHDFCQANSTHSDASITPYPQQSQRGGSTHGTATTPAAKKTTRSASTDSSTSTESSASSTAVRAAASTTPAKQTTKPEPAANMRPRGSIEMVAEKKPFQSRFLPNHSTAAAAAAKKEESESSSEEETSSEESEEEEEEPPKPAPVRDTSTKADTSTYSGRASQARESYADTSRRNSRDETSLRGGYSSPTYGRSLDNDTSSSRYSTATTGVRSRPSAYTEPDDHSSRYGSGSSG